MVKKRLFTFGCSHTNWIWPTWADFIGYFYEEYHNYGKAGCGNFFALSHLYEVNEKYKLDKDDTVLIMLSDDNRPDIIQPMGSWTAAGSIYGEGGENYYGKTFLEKIWSPLHGKNNTWVCLKSMISFLEEVGCTYRIYTGFDLNDNFCGSEESDILKKRIKSLVSNPNYLQSYIDEKNPRYHFLDPDTNTLKSDGHATMEEHLNWVRNEANEFYDVRMEELLKEWNTYKTEPLPFSAWNDCNPSKIIHKEIIGGTEITTPLFQNNKK